MLGSCPTCSGKIASSASVCPHCGETKFEVTVREAKESRACPDCGGRGYSWSNASSSVHPGTGKRTFSEAGWYWCTYCYMTGVVLDHVEYKRDQRTGSVDRLVTRTVSGEHGGFPRKPKP